MTMILAVAAALALGGAGFALGLTAFLWAAGREMEDGVALRRLEEAFGHGYRAGRRDGKMRRDGT